MQNLVNTKIRHLVVFPEVACRLSVWSDEEGIKEGGGVTQEVTVRVRGVSQKAPVEEEA